MNTSKVTQAANLAREQAMREYEKRRKATALLNSEKLQKDKANEVRLIMQNAENRAMDWNRPAHPLLLFLKLAEHSVRALPKGRGLASSEQKPKPKNTTGHQILPLAVLLR